MNTPKSKALPSREVSYNYCVAMFIAQQFEDDLRYLLDSGDYYGIIDELELTKPEKKKFKDTAEWLDNVPSGRLLAALKTRLNLDEKHWDALVSVTAVIDGNVGTLNEGAGAERGHFQTG